MQNDAISEICNTLVELRRMHQLNMELLEQLGVACGWLLEHNIPIPNASTFASLVTKSLALLKEIQAEEPRMLQYQKLSDESKQPRKPDGEVTGPGVAVLISQLFEAIEMIADSCEDACDQVRIIMVRK